MTSSKPIKLPLSMAEVDRAAHLRLDDGYLKDAWKTAQVLQFQDEKFLAIDNQLNFVTGAELGEYQAQSDYFLGVTYIADSTDGVKLANELTAIRLKSPSSNTTAAIAAHYFVRNYAQTELSDDKLKTLRQIGAFLPPRDIGLAVHAQGLANWHKKHARCSQCGAATTVISGGSVRKCLIDESEHYPRTDSAIIVLVKDEQDRILLGRQKVWPKNRFSTFAGFVEPGESFEHCVVREVGEEAGVHLRKINYLGSQPWPFPSSLMIAFEAITDNPTAARPDGDEIEEIRWFSRDQMKQAISDSTLILPLEISVARQMINAWYGDNAVNDLKGAESWR